MRVGQIYAQGSLGYRHYIVHPAATPQSEIELAAEENRDPANYFWMMTMHGGDVYQLITVTEPPQDTPEVASLGAGDDMALSLGRSMAAYREQTLEMEREVTRTAERMNNEYDRQRDRFNNALNELLRGREGEELVDQIIAAMIDYGFRPPARHADIKTEIIGYSDIGVDTVAEHLDLAAQAGLHDGAEVQESSGSVRIRWRLELQLTDEYDGTRTCPCQDGRRLTALIATALDEMGVQRESASARSASCNLCTPVEESTEEEALQEMANGITEAVQQRTQRRRDRRGRFVAASTAVDEGEPEIEPCSPDCVTCQEVIAADEARRNQTVRPVF